MPFPPKVAAAKWLAAALMIVVVIAGSAVLWMVSRRPAKQVQPAAVPSSPGAAPIAATPGTVAPPTAPSPVKAAPVAAAATPPGFQREPLAVSRESRNYRWTAEDGRLPEVIHKLAHNPMEEKRMLAENPRIKARQLVYIKQPVAALMEQARLTGEKLQTLVLPGLDGEELPFEITGSELQPSGQIGTFTGHLAGRPQSAVSLSYKFGREAFTILSPEDGNNFDAEPREPGQVIVKSIDPDEYSPLIDRVLPPGAFVATPTPAPPGR